MILSGMRPAVIGWQLAKARREAGLTQSELAARIRTTQSAVSRVEAGRTLPSLRFLERFARATGRPLTITFGEVGPRAPSRAERRARVRRVLGDFVFDPWRRSPTPAEARSLEADGLTRERFQGATTS